MWMLFQPTLNQLQMVLSLSVGWEIIRMEMDRRETDIFIYGQLWDN